MYIYIYIYIYTHTSGPARRADRCEAVRDTNAARGAGWGERNKHCILRVCVCVSIHTHTYLYIHMHTHTYIYIYIYSTMIC